MKIRLKKYNDKNTVYDITELVSSLTWGGTHEQASRKAEVSLLHSPFDKDFPALDINNGDILYIDEEKENLFTGRVLKKENPAKPGERSISAFDFMNLLLKSKKSYNFKNMTAEKIAEKVIKDAGLKAGSIEKTNVVIQKWIVESESAYNIILGAYQRAKKKTGKGYRLYMNGAKVCIGTLNETTGVKLTDSDSVTAATLSEDAEEIINRVYIVNDKNKKIGEVKNENSIKVFGEYSDVYKKTEDENPEKAAKELLKNPVKEIGPLEAVGDIRCVSGKSVEVTEKNTGLTGKFFITEDSHTWQNGVHTMSLKLKLDKIMEGFDEKSRKVAAGDEVCYYTEGSKKFHSDKKCGTGLVHPIKSTVNEAQKTGREKCSMCWA